MSDERPQRQQDLIQFLRTIQKPNRRIENIGGDESLFAAGVIDSLAVIQIALYLEQSYGIDFAASGLDPQRLSTTNSILDLIEELRADADAGPSPAPMGDSATPAQSDTETRQPTPSHSASRFPVASES
jgi:acyl carrier protein